MPARGFEKISREEVVQALQRYAKTHGENITLAQFARRLGVSATVIYSRWGRWHELRRAAGLKRPRKPATLQYSDTFLLSEYRRVTREVGHPPSMAEFNQRSTCRLGTLMKRFGNLKDIRRRARIQEDFVREFGWDKLLPRKPKLTWDEAWLAELWTRVRIGFALYSSDLMHLKPFPFDVVFCARHDWPVCPAAVLVAEAVLGDRVRDDPPPSNANPETTHDAPPNTPPTSNL